MSILYIIASVLCWALFILYKIVPESIQPRHSYIKLIVLFILNTTTLALLIYKDALEFVHYIYFISCYILIFSCVLSNFKKNS